MAELAHRLLEGAGRRVHSTWRSLPARTPSSGVVSAEAPTPSDCFATLAASTESYRFSPSERDLEAGGNATEIIIAKVA